jgi:protein ImuB
LIAALDERAEALGLKRGMGVADARAMYPAIDVVEADPQAERRLLEGLADWCDRYTPLVALDGADGLFLDITGCVHLFGGEEAILAEMVTRFLHQGFCARAGIASTVGAAWAAARFYSGRSVAAGGEEEFLAPLPLAALRLEPGVRDRLESVGLRTMGAVMAMPRAPLARRFGAPLLARLDQALGRFDEAVSPRRPAAALSVERHLPEPVARADDVEHLTKSLAQALRPDLERRGEGARSLHLVLFRVDGAVSRIAVRTSRPLRDPVLIQKLFHERLVAIRQELDAGFGFDLVRLSVLAAAPFSLQQTDLAGDTGGEGADLEQFADRVRARLGESAVLRSLPVASHLPERAARLVPFAQAARERLKAASSLALSERPIRLLRPPEPVEVPVTELPEGPPLRFRWRRAVYSVRRAEGPERIGCEWWQENHFIPRKENEKEEAYESRRLRLIAERTVSSARDYFRVEDSEGRRYWLYRQGLYGAAKVPPRWFMHGFFA